MTSPQSGDSLVAGSMCVCRVFIFKDTGVQPHLSVGLTSVRQKGGLPGPPPVIPLPESLAAKGGLM